MRPRHVSAGRRVTIYLLALVTAGALVPTTSEEFQPAVEHGEAVPARRLAREQKQPIVIGGETFEEDVRFTGIREIMGVSGEFLARPDYIDMSNIVGDSGGLHAQLVFSKDKEWILKVSSSDDWYQLHNILDDYDQYLHEQPNSLLPRFLTAFKDITGRRWLAMFNWVRPGLGPQYYHRKYDLKGTTCSVTSGDRLVRVELYKSKFPTLKDLNFAQIDEALHVPKEIRLQLIQQIRDDTFFLQQHNLMDYSMILDIHHVGQCDKAVLQAICQPAGSTQFKAPFQSKSLRLATVVESESMMYVYNFGIIDVLENYGTSKAIANLIKNMRCSSVTDAGEQQDTVQPKIYRDRFVRYWEEKIMGTGREVAQEECEYASPGTRPHEPPTGGGGGGGDESVCKDDNEECASWASMGECAANPDWMHLNCRRSCGLCNDNPPGESVRVRLRRLQLAGNASSGGLRATAAAAAAAAPARSLAHGVGCALMVEEPPTERPANGGAGTAASSGAAGGWSNTVVIFLAVSLLASLVALGYVMHQQQGKGALHGGGFESTTHIELAPSERGSLDMGAVRYSMESRPRQSIDPPQQGERPSQQPIVQPPMQQSAPPPSMPQGQPGDFGLGAPTMVQDPQWAAPSSWYPGGGGAGGGAQYANQPGGGFRGGGWS
eukprot:TRINITY_DN11672_c0_g1_i2.p1 TRINITY_DN11672_c0_g1~~TRINITY_DN11672_c0_g1_i2.p1  ORF type:complete len:661 (-),score=146.02 TRINITY_DN11672_c0_g1_i2:297-2279(-)